MTLDFRLVLMQAATTNAGDAIGSLDWPSILAQGGTVPLIVWMAYEIIHLRRENDRLNEATREMAKTSVEALMRLAGERRT